MFLKKTSPSLYEALGVYLPLITTNCAVLGIALTNVQNYNTAAGLNIGQKLLDSVVSGLGTAVGFTIAIIIMAGIRERNEFNDVRKALRECLLYYLLQDLWLSHSLDFQVLFKRRTTRCQV